MITGSLQEALARAGVVKLAVLFSAADGGWTACATDGRSQSRNGYGATLEEAVCQSLDAIGAMKGAT